ncbi:hypothetical protein Peur_033317 [Populus x canadensis]
MKINSRTLAALFVLILVHILASSSLCLCHEESSLIPSKRSTISRKLLATPMKSRENKLGDGKMKEAKKAVEQSLRKAPPSVSNPIQN